MNNTLIFTLEILGTIAFAASGAMVGVHKKMDIFGVCVLGVITACGGGMIRDVILGITPPNVFQNPIYVIVATITSCVVFLTLYIHKGRFRNEHLIKFYDYAMLMMDSLGLGVFTSVGVNTGIQNGYASQTFLLVFVGTITGVGGGLLRDMMAGVPPYIFVKHIYACASIVGAFACVLIYRNFGLTPAMAISSIIVVLIRYMAAYYRWNLPKLDSE
ncbi:MAG: trimeric intracellular cation channel family protein [Lachnospiraceae bacterium]